MALLPSRPSPARNWASTRWSAVGDLTCAESKPRERAWEVLVQTYQRPMVGFVRSLLRRIRPAAPSDIAEDIVQEFLADCLDKEWLGRAAAERGSFRSFVRKILHRAVLKYVRHQEAKKRMPGDSTRLYSLDHAIFEGGDDASAPDAELEALNRAWVGAALDRALETLRLEHLRSYEVIADLIAGGGTQSADLARRLGAPPEQMPVLRHRARARFVKLFELEVRATVRDQEAFEAEWRVLAPYLP